MELSYYISVMGHITVEGSDMKVFTCKKKRSSFLIIPDHISAHTKISDTV